MSVASDIVHEEFHDRDFAQRGGLFEIVRLWMNLPAKDRISQSRYQNILNNQTPTSKLPDNQRSVRIIADKFDELRGPIHTFTPIHIWVMRLDSKQAINLAVPEGYNTLLAVLKGSARVNYSETICATEITIFALLGITFA